MKKQILTVCLLLAVLAAGTVTACADGQVRDLDVSEIRTTSAMAVWNCTDKSEQQYTLSYHIDGIGRSETRLLTAGEDGTDYRLRYLCPATTYVLTVSPESGVSDTITFTTPYAIDYTKYSYALLDTGLFRSTSGKKDYSAIEGLNSQTLSGEVLDYDFHFMFQFSLAESDDDKPMEFLLLLTLPNGDVYAINEEYWYTEKAATVTQYVKLTDTLTQVLSDYGTFPTGDYTLTAYFKGEFAAEMAFSME